MKPTSKQKEQPFTDQTRTLHPWQVQKEVASSLLIATVILGVSLMGVYGLFGDAISFGAYVLSFSALLVGGYLARSWQNKLQGSIKVYPDRLLASQCHGLESFKFEEIKGIRLVYLPWYMARFEVQLDSGRKFWLGEHWTRIENLFDAIYQFNPSLVSERQYDSFRMWLVLCDFQWTRFEKIVELSKVYLFFKFLGYAAVIQAAILFLGPHDLEFPRDLTLLGLSFVGVFLANFIYATMFLGILRSGILILKDYKRLKKRPFDVKRDLKYEARVYQTTEIIFFATTFLFWANLIWLQIGF